MTAPKHTPGTWGYMQQPNGAIVIRGEPDADQEPDGHVTDLTEYLAEMIGGEHDEANAARIVAAVNYCAGVSTEGLVSGLATCGGLARVLDSSAESARSLGAMLDATRAQLKAADDALDSLWAAITA